jgi:sugar lactone lactonase YvrE
MTIMQPDALVGAGHGLIFTESPRWRGDRLWFIDIHGSAIKSVNLGGDLRTELALPFKPNGLGFLSDGRIMFSDALALKVMCWDGSTLNLVADLIDDAVFCLSDAIVDAKDRFYVSDIGYNFWNPAAKPSDACVIIRIDPDGTIANVAGDLSFPNGLAVSADGTTLIIAETDGFRLSAYDIDDEGGLHNHRIFAQLPEGIQPDGIAVDQEGGVWLANPAGNPAVLRVEEGGTITDQIDLDTHAYAVAIGGPAQNHLFICTSASHDPAEIAERPSAAILVADIG